MRRHAVLLTLCCTFVVAAALHGATAGKANGSFVVGKKATPLKVAYVIEKNKLLRIVLADQPLDEGALYDADALQKVVDERMVSAVVIQLDEDRKADSSFFFHGKLPAGLEVREVGRFEPSRSTDAKLAGRVVMKDDGFSFGYDATFEAPILVQLQKVDPLPADASKADHALWRLKQMEVPYDPSEFRGAVLRGEAEVVQLFLEAGMPPDTEDALRTAASSHHVDVMKMLIDAHADINKANAYGITPLAVAAEQGQLDIVKELIAGGAKVNARDTSGGSAVMVAVLRGYKDVLAALLAAGGDVQRDRAELLEMAKDKPEIKAMLEQALARSKKK